MSEFGLFFLRKTSCQLSKIFVLSLLIRIVTNASINLPIEPSNSPTLTSLHQPNLGFDRPYCTSSPDWFQPGFRHDDCLHAVMRIMQEEVVPHGKENFKFMARGASPMRGLPLMQTPRIYVSGE